MIAASLTGAAMTLVLALSPSGNVNATRTSVPIELATQALSSSDSIRAIEDSKAKLAAATQTLVKRENWQTFDIKSGNTLSTLFANAGYNDKIMYSVLNATKGAKQLASIYPGEQISFLNDQNSAKLS